MKPWQYWSLSGVVIVVAGLYVGGWFMAGQSLPRDTTIAGVDVSSMTAVQAQRALEKGTAERLDEPIVATFEDTTVEFKPSEFNFDVDFVNSVAQAGGQRSWSPRAIWRLVAGGGDLPPVFSDNTTALRANVAQIASDIDIAVIEPRIVFPKGEPKIKDARFGVKVDQPAFVSQIKSAYLMTAEPIVMPADQIRPQATSKDAHDALETIAKPAVSGPVTLDVSGRDVELPVSVWAPALSVVPVNGTMTAKLNPEKLEKPLLKATATGANKPVSAKFTFRSGNPVIVPSKQGVGVDAKAVAVDLIPVLAQQGSGRKLAVSTTQVEPAFTTADAEKLGIKQRVSNFVTYYPYSPYRDINQSEAARRINGHIIMPGETFSFNDVVGPRTAANGFVKGNVISGGVFKLDYGGGVSQVATTTFNASFFAGLEDVEHHPHSLYLSRYPVGREATVSYGALDLRFTNPYDTGIVIRAWVNKSGPGRQGEMHVQMYGTKVYEIKAGHSARRNFRSGQTRTLTGPGCAPQSPITGFDIDIYRTFKQNGKTVRKETHTTRYKAGDRIVCGS